MQNSTLEYRADPPHANWSLTVVLPEDEFHVEERDSTEYHHKRIWYEEGSYNGKAGRVIELTASYLNVEALGESNSENSSGIQDFLFLGSRLVYHILRTKD